MAKDDTTDDADEDVTLHLALKKLKVDPEWDESKVLEAATTYKLQDLWSGESENGASHSEVSPRRLKHKLSHSEKSRAEPYPGDCVTSLQRLCLSKEKCTKKFCTCKIEKSGSSLSSPRHKLNLVHVAGQQRKLIHEARLKFHNAQKDQRQVIRAAKLHLHQSFSGANKSNKKEQGKLDLVELTPRSDVFGSSTKINLANFSSLFTKKSEIKVKQDSSMPCFSGYRETPVVTSPRNLLSSSKVAMSGKGKAKNRFSTSPKLSRRNKSPPQTPYRDHNYQREPMAETSARVEYSVEKSCSQEARLDDLSVNELAGYFEDFVHIPRKMSTMAEMMYT